MMKTKNENKPVRYRKTVYWRESFCRGEN